MEQDAELWAAILLSIIFNTIHLFVCILQYTENWLHIAHKRWENEHTIRLNWMQKAMVIKIWMLIFSVVDQRKDDSTSIDYNARSLECQKIDR